MKDIIQLSEDELLIIGSNEQILHKTILKNLNKTEFDKFLKEHEEINAFTITYKD